MLTYNKIKIGIIDCKLNNLFSIYNAFKSIGYKTSIIDLKKKNFKNFDLIALPGVGSFGSAMKIIKKNNIDKKIIEYIEKDKFFLGICLGMQLLFEKSYEFQVTKGIGLLKGEVKKINFSRNYPVPHIGWNKIFIKKKNPLIKNKKNFYFVHSFFCKPSNQDNILSETIYGKKKFCSSIKFKNLIATQFHPEKSGLQGIEFLKNLKKMI